MTDTTKSLTSALDTLLVAARSLTDCESAVDLIRKAVDSPLVYSFSELLDVPLIMSVCENKFFYLASFMANYSLNTNYGTKK